MKKLITFAVLSVLTCLLGNSALAQNRAIYKPVTETIDFSTYGGSGSPGNGRLSFDNGHPQIDGQVISERLTVDNPSTNVWGFWGSDTYNETYLQLQQNVGQSSARLSDLKAGDVVTIWGECGNDGGDFNIYGALELLNTTDYEYNGVTYPNSKEYRITNAGTAEIQCRGNYSGIRKITIVSQQRQESYFDYDPGYEDYDMYDEFSSNDPKKYDIVNGRPQQLNPPQSSTTYTLSSEETGITLNEQPAQYIVLSGSKITANYRIAVDGSAGTWRFNYGLRAPDNGKWANFSICNLKEGDRVLFSYTGTAPVFSSVAGGTTAPTGPYNGSKAFGDLYNDGTFDEGEDIYIADGANPEIDWQRGEGAIYMEDHQGNQGDYELKYTRPYVITEDGHLDIAIAPDTRIVHIKIYSDHQASMVDSYENDSYIARFDITGELQAMEHIIPGGLEVHVGSNDASQHAHVVSSPHGPVSMVNGVDGFKLPGMTLDDNGNLQFEFDLANNIPETGTFYKFMPLEDGKMNLTFQANSMNYYTYGLNGDEVYYGDLGTYGDNTWLLEWDRPNEQTREVTCPYYLVKVDERGNKQILRTINVSNGVDYSIEDFNVKAGETYYLYGGWNASGLYFNGSGQGQNNLEYFPYGAGNGGTDKACGVAKLLEIVFNPNKKIYPLAKWVPNGTAAVNDANSVPNPDTFEAEIELADLWGYDARTRLTVKKMSGNITGCRPYLQRVPNDGNHFKLMIDGITFEQGKDQGGTILIKIGETNLRTNPVYALTIAYSADETFDGNSGTGTRGHIWDYSSNSLNGLKWNAPYRANGAVEEDYGHYFADYFAEDISQYSSNDEVFENLSKSGSGLLNEEISSGNSDWMFNYNLVNAGKLYDPLFSNKYDLEGDNADLIWNTEGTVLLTSANSSVMFNEFTGDDVHESAIDPDRYVGILSGGEFRIPWLMPNDRVIIYMGTGKGAFNDQAVFNIRGAYDAVHNTIEPTDNYIVGGSHWDGADGDNNYRGCYHFFAQGHEGGPADMVFKMTAGTMCKIYSIQIYRGDRIITNEIVGETADDNKYFMWSSAADPNDDTTEDYTDEHHYNWTLKYLGKEQQLANGSGTYNQDNEIVARTGKYSSETPVLTDNHEDAEDPDSKVTSFTYIHQLGEIGTFRMRGKDMEKNMNYVADYADHNATIAFQETQKYPYTWDFTDVTGIEANVTHMFAPEEQLGEEEEAPEGISDDDWAAAAESYQRTARDLSLWEVNSTNGNYFLRLNSQASQTPQNLMVQDNIFETAKEIDGNQVWANGAVVPEMQGLWFYTENNNQRNGEWNLIKGDANNVGGLEFDGSSPLFKKIVVPNVPANAAVYLRLTNIAEDGAVIKYRFGNGDFLEFTDQGPDNGNGTVRFYEVGSTGDYIVALLNTNSSKSNLTFAVNGYRIQKLAVSTDFKKVNKFGWATESRDHEIDPSLTSELTGNTFNHYLVTGASHADLLVTLTNIDNGVYMPAAVEDGNQAYIIRNMDVDTDESNTEPGLVKILKVNGVWGFHLFVPDMNDYLASRPSGDYRTNRKHDQSLTNNLLLSRLDGNLSQKDGYVYNYVLTTSTTNVETGNVTDYDNVVFARVPAQGMKGGKNVGYLPVDCSDGNNSANMHIMIAPTGESEDSVIGIEVSDDSLGGSNAVYYNLNGQKLDGMPTTGGIYIVNGKKVVVK